MREIVTIFAVIICDFFVVLISIIYIYIYIYYKQLSILLILINCIHRLYKKVERSSVFLPTTQQKHQH